MPVLKANAYGHGLTDMAAIFRKMKIKYLGVATLGEAILLRKNGDRGRILAWLYDVNSNELSEALKLDIDIAIFDDTMISTILRHIPLGKTAKITAYVDTGINRTGIPYNKAVTSCIELSKYDNVDLVGLMSHLVCSPIPNSPIVKEQLHKFRALRKDLEDINIRPPLVHIANTGACMNYDVSDFTLSRVGSGVYGLSSKPTKSLHIAMTIKSCIVQIKSISKGEGVGYFWTYRAPRYMPICIVPVGYADVLPKNASGRLYVYINGTKRKVLGQISMDQITVEARAGDRLNDDVFIFGNGTNCPQTIYDISKASKYSVSEMLSHIGYRINRIYN